ncbi:putative sulfate transporter [Colletotrichum fructicola]|uniref:Sulfate transporter n=1 Tax=Colletotrichum fructicola (strain Nara gc5) TaxID=1213859 RepID=L2FPM9_COLFN|nr:putative sulfate transporter [Colletotrichum fructicola]KAF4489983.1 putative sulfate transporter [Colletotrichum fructicola Nara gc5]KAE9571128.1 putative sulfate transporter [Colletotrichum fructicola]KAF4422021.1 putative sulfate transporter [Colletotrichum fructicola]KAF4889100.1 putative sulfate transporter [Colletotrichum fructicola]KAF4936947.1 putative sulfate transporter [Colletotrichum fructicola]
MSGGRPQPNRSPSSQQHLPMNPSGLRQSYTMGSPPVQSPGSIGGESEYMSTREDATPLATPLPNENDSGRDTPRAGSSLGRPNTFPPSESTSLLQNVLIDNSAPTSYTHGTFSPRPISPTGSARSADMDRPSSSASSIPILDSVLTTITGDDHWRKRFIRKLKSKKMTSSRTLAEQAGFKDTVWMYLSYYIPLLTWLPQYQWSYLKGDLVAALTLASLYLPMALSLADNLAHVPPINGLYAFVFNPFIYAIFGSAPQMVVGPEAAGSLLVGSVVRGSIDHDKDEEYNAELQAKICGVVAGMAGATVLMAGIARLGFLDSVLSRPFLRGFISAIGFVIAVDQAIPELGLAKYAAETGVGHGSSMDKLEFIFTAFDHVHKLTFIVAGVSFVIMMVMRELKKHMTPKYPGVAYIPDRFFVVVVAAILSWRFDWASKGVEILGPVKAASGHVFTFRWPFQTSHMEHIREAMGTSFLIALLGFFESSVAAKSLSSSDSLHGIQLSPNRELVALGAANVVGACFMSLPAFGGYGRSKLNKQTGGKTPMSSIFLSAISLAAIMFLLPYFYYLPKPVLSSMISVVAYSLLEEAPHDIAFFLRIRGWTELGLMTIIFVSTIFYSLTLGMAIGVGLSLLQVIKHSTRPRIQILGRIPGTHRFENAELNPDRLEFVEGCLIVKIPEPLTFANTGELKARLRRLELYGTSMAHPALPRLRGEHHNKNVIFDIHGVTSLDGSGTQVLEEIVRSYRERGVRVFFSRGPTNPRHHIWRLMRQSGIIDLVGGESHFVTDVQEALKLTEYEHSINEANNP